MQPYIFKSFQQLFRSKRLIVWAIISAHFAFQKSKMDLGIELYNVCCMVLIVLTMYYICCTLGIARRYHYSTQKNSLQTIFGLMCCTCFISFTSRTTKNGQKSNVSFCKLYKTILVGPLALFREEFLSFLCSNICRKDIKHV